MRIVLLRSLACAALVAALVAVGAWGLAPNLPLASGRDLSLFPFATLAANASLRGALPIGVALTCFALVGASLVVGSLLSLWLALRAAANPAARRLALASSLGVVASAYFVFFRDLPPWLLRDAASAGLLDFAALVAYASSLIALVACFRIYPRAFAVDDAVRDVEQLAELRRRIATRLRARASTLRALSWLPPERFGEAIPDAGGTSHGLFSRSLRSRELAWLVAALLVGSAAAGFGPGSGAARAVFAVVASFAVLALLDPVFRARVRTSRTLRAWHRRSNVALATSADAAHRMVGSPVGIALVLLGVGWAWRLWHGTDLAGHALFHVVVLGVMLAAVLEALSLLSLHWRVGDEGDRRAIAWVLLGSFGSLVAWLLVVVVAGAYAAMRWDEPAGAASGAKRALGTVLTVGPFVVALLAIVATAVSALARGSFDAAMALRRGTVYGLLGVVLTGLFVAVEGLASSIVVVRVGMPSETGAFIAGTATALAFGPLRSRVEARVRALLDRMLPAMSLADAERRTCVVAFCDLVGYTSLAASDEPESLRQAALLHEAARRTVAGERGRVVKTLGDAVMLGFDEPRVALAGIAALWRAYREGAGAVGLDPLPLHASAHAGEVAVARDGDLFGANVNLAARLLGIAGADELALTGELREVVKASGWPHRECEPVALRNVPEPVPILRILLRDVQGARA